VTRHCNCHRHY